ncbi:MAG TPA: 16S rRNA (guanine(527)-N(7))-methyltransferase RsmG [Anaerolineae bacterium]|nr:16S rRNA (guanine(527)-N(7))-methyltransferase RsmG [Anaerolineae bacterium]
MTGSRAAARQELPTDADQLEPMGEEFDLALEAGLDELGLLNGPAAAPLARRSYEAHARLLRDWSAAINLTAIREPAAIARRHTCDSLSAVDRLAGLTVPGATLLDLGSGGGYPGLPLAAALPLTRVALVDSVGKKARFLRVAATAVASVLATAADAAPTIETMSERAEDLAEEPDQRAAWGIVTARAVGSLAEVIELAMPLVREGGAVVAWKREEERGGLRAELRDAGSIIRASGGGRPEVLTIEASFLAGHRLVVVPKQRPTPAGYPRPASIRRRRKR